MQVTTNRINVYQFARTGTKADYPATPNYTDVNAAIMPAGTDILTTYGGEAGFQLYEIFVYDMTIDFKTGDKLVDNTGQTYFVAGVQEKVNNRITHYIKLAAKVEV